MKYLLLVPVLLLSVSSAWANCGDPGDPCIQCQTVDQLLTTVSLNVTMAQAPVVGHAIVIWGIYSRQGSPSIRQLPIDNQGNTYVDHAVQDGTEGSYLIQNFVNFANIVSTGDPFTVTIRAGLATDTSFTIALCEFSVSGGAGGLADQVGGLTTLTMGPASVVAAGPNTNPHAMVVAAGYGSVPVTPPGYTLILVGTAAGGRMVYKTVDMIETSVAPFTNGRANTFVGVLATYRNDAAVTPPPPPTTLITGGTHQFPSPIN